MAAPTKRLDLVELGQLSFERPDEGRFRALGLARQAMQRGGMAPAVLNAANEVAVEAFLTRRIGFLQIAELVAETLDMAEGRNLLAEVDDLSGVLAVDAAARGLALNLLERWSAVGGAMIDGCARCAVNDPDWRRMQWSFYEPLTGGFGKLLTFTLPFLFVLIIVVFVHELGHFLVARWCGVKVKAFSIGFGKEIFGFYDRYGTRWRFAWVPLGGYVKFLDDENSASVPSRDALARMTPGRARGSVPEQVTGGAGGHRGGRADRQFPAGDSDLYRVLHGHGHARDGAARRRAAARRRGGQLRLPGRRRDPSRSTASRSRPSTTCSGWSAAAPTRS